MDIPLDQLAATASPELRALWGRVGAGMTWLTEHDPSGAFHIWFQSGLTASSPMPSVKGGTARVDEWRAYYQQRRIWEQLWRQMTQLEEIELRRGDA